MPINSGVVSLSAGDDVVVRFYYDTAFVPVGDTQPLANGPRGFCLDITNLSGRQADVTVLGFTASPQTVRIGSGDPVTTGPAAGRSRTAAQAASFGVTTRGDLNGLSLVAGG